MHYAIVISLWEPECGSLNVIGPHNLIGSGIIRRYSFVGVDMAMLEKMSLESGHELSCVQDMVHCLS